MANQKITSINEEKTKATTNEGREVELADKEFEVGESVVVRQDGKGYHRLED